jgi:hypothetical protein
MKEDVENQRIVDLGSYKIQAKWLSVGIDEMQRKDLSWQKILYQCSDRLLKFIVNAIQPPSLECSWFTDMNFVAK